ncbi:MAG: hypothetical protein IJG81_02560 [Muribaculaceae bacterium]|nr:hypothetical protein [Muribaculaceae bacterium]
MKRLIISMSVLILCAVATTNRAEVIAISHSNFVSDIYPNVDEPIVILFGSNYCGNSKQQLKMLKRKETEYGDRIKFYCVNADTNENYEWLVQVAKEEEFDELGVPSWLFYYGNYKDGDGVNHYVIWSGAGIIPESTMDGLLKEQIRCYYR